MDVITRAPSSPASHLAAAGLPCLWEVPPHILLDWGWPWLSWGRWVPGIRCRLLQGQASPVPSGSSSGEFHWVTEG